MATEQNLPNNMEDFGDAIGQAVAKGIAATQPPRKMTPGEYARREAQRNPKPKLKFTALIQNGVAIDVPSTGGVTPKAVLAMNKFTHSGRYLDRRVEVILHEQGTDAVLDIRYSNKSSDQRMENKSLFRNFEDLVCQIADAQVAEDAEDAASGKKLKRG
jgi:hypothetical protein